MLYKLLFIFLVVSYTIFCQDLILDGRDTTMFGVQHFNNVVLKNGATINLSEYLAGTQKGKLILFAKNITIEAGSRINADGKGNIGLSVIGHGGGAGHGGQGGYSNYATNVGGTTYGSKLGNYIDMGTKGDNGVKTGGMGGGSIIINCHTILIHGELTANGSAGENGSISTGTGGGGGSGGGILITAKNIYLDGKISANGGNGGIHSQRDAGGGGGGRIKLFYENKNILGDISVRGGLAGNSGQAGFLGTIGYDNYPTSPILISPLSYNYPNNYKPQFKLISTDNDISDRLLYKIEISKDTFKTIFDTFNQMIDPQGWSKVVYNLGDTAYYSSQSALSIGHYAWRAYAYDGNVWSDGWNWEKPYSTTFGEFTVGVTDVNFGNQNIVNNFELDQNYPNPFNPSTNINFTLPNSEFVTLKIFDILGKEVTTLINEELNSGRHTKIWDAKNLSSGVYFYKLQAGKFNETKKMILVR